MLGLLPDIDDWPAIRQALAIPLQPVARRWSGRHARRRRAAAAPTTPTGQRAPAPAAARPAPRASARPTPAAGIARRMLRSRCLARSCGSLTCAAPHAAACRRRPRPASRPTAGRSRPGHAVRGAARRRGRRPRASSPTRWRAARRPCWRRPAPTGRAGVPPRPLITDAEPRRALARWPRRMAGRAAGDGGRRHRHQRQDQHGRVPAPALGGDRRAGRQPRHAGRDRARPRRRAPA